MVEFSASLESFSAKLSFIWLIQDYTDLLSIQYNTKSLSFRWVLPSFFFFACEKDVPPFFFLILWFKGQKSKQFESWILLWGLS